MLTRTLIIPAILSICVLLASAPVAGRVLYVPDDYPTIQAGIDMATDGDTVVVRPGTYAENVRFNGKAIELKSEQGAVVTIIDGVIQIVDGEDQRTVLDGFTIRDGPVNAPGIYCLYSSPTIRNNIIKDRPDWGIVVNFSKEPALILNNIIKNNFTWDVGAGLSTTASNPHIIGNTFINNHCRFPGSYLGGGAVFVYAHEDGLVIEGNTFIGNIANHLGGAIYFFGGSGTRYVTNNVFIGNNADAGGVFGYSDTNAGNPDDRGAAVRMVVGNCLFAGNSATIGSVLDNGDGSEVEFHNCTFTGNGDADLLFGACTVSNSIIWGNRGPVATGAAVINWSLVQGGYPGKGNIDEDPLFVGGPAGNCYLSQVAAGQASDSPGLDSGNGQAADTCYPLTDGQVCMNQRATRTDLVADAGSLDIGYHYPLQPAPASHVCAAGPGDNENNPPLIRVFADSYLGIPIAEWPAYGTSGYGVNVAVAELDGRPGVEVLTGAGPGGVNGPHVRGFDIHGTSLPGVSFLAYGSGTHGVNVAGGDIDGDGFEEIVTGAGPGELFGPHVRCWNWDGQGTTEAIPGLSWIAYGTPKWGVNVACGDLDGDGRDEVVTGAGPGAVYGPHVRGWSVEASVAMALPEVSFLAYGTNRFGVNVACGDLDGDGFDEMVTGPGPGALFGSHVRGWNWDGTGMMNAIASISFLAYDDLRWGVNVSCGDVDDDGIDEIVTGPGPDPAAMTRIRGWNFDGSSLTVIEGFDADAFDTSVTHGVNVAAGRF